MLTSRTARISAAAATAFWLSLSTSSPALAHHEVICPPDGGDCIVVAHTPDAPGEPGDDGDSGGGGSATCSWDGHAVPCYDQVRGWFDGDGCYWKRVDPQPPAGDPAWQGHAPGDGDVYYISCIGAWGSTGGYSGLIWRATPPPGFGGLPSPAQLAAEAVNKLPIRGPLIGVAPRPDGAGLVGLPVWLWTQVSPETWGPSSATASVPGLSVTATARATKIVWSMGDGATVTCASPGTPYKPAYGNRPSPDCGYTGYTRPSSTVSGGRYTITGTTTWAVRWFGGGQSGTLTVTRRSTTSIDVDELQVVTS